MDLLIKILRLDWWVYVAIVVTFFSVALVLNYVVKKINEARLEERFARIQNKASNNQSIQVQRRTESKLLKRSPLEIVLEQSNPSTVKGISMEIDKNNQPIDLNKDRIDIKNFPSSGITSADVSDVPPGNEAMEKGSDNDIPPPAFLGHIYKELCVMERSKSMSNADNDIGQGGTDEVNKKQESQSVPSVKKLLDDQNMEDIKEWSLSNVVENSISDHKPTTSTVLVKE